MVTAELCAGRPGLTLGQGQRPQPWGGGGPLSPVLGQQCAVWGLRGWGAGVRACVRAPTAVTCSQQCPPSCSHLVREACCKPSEPPVAEGCPCSSCRRETETPRSRFTAWPPREPATPPHPPAPKQERAQRSKAGPLREGQNGGAGGARASELRPLLFAAASVFRGARHVVPPSAVTVPDVLS